MKVVCEFKLESWTSGMKYTCRVQSLLRTKPEYSIKAYIGAQMPGKGENDVTGFFVHQQVFECIPRGISASFPNLTNVALEYCRIKTLTKGDFYGFENVQDLSFAGNLLKSLPDNLFEDMKRLKEIYFEKNAIEYLSPKLIEPVKKTLKIADFSCNSSIDFKFTKKRGNSIELLMTEIENCCKHFPIANYSAITAKWKQLLSTKILSDFTVKVGRTHFQTHKVVLAAQSTVFEAMMRSDMKEGHANIVEISGFSAGAVEDLLHFFYSGEIRSSVNVMDLFALAGIYDVPALKALCEDIILLHIDESNALEVFNLGSLHLSEPLKQTAFDFIKRMFPNESLDNGLIHDVERVNELISSKRSFDMSLKRCRKQ